MEAVIIPLINPNEPEALLAAMFVAEGQHVHKDEPLCTLETTKSTAEVTAEREGYVAGLRFTAGQTARAGEVFCYLADRPGEPPPVPDAPTPGVEDAQELPAGLRVSMPALELAKGQGLNLGRLPTCPSMAVYQAN